MLFDRPTGLAIIVLLGVLAGGCGETVSSSEEQDPAKLSPSLFASKPDRILLAPDPDDPGSQITWEIRNLLRVQSFLAKTCTLSAEPSCRHLLLGFSEYRLDGSIEVAVSFPSRNPSGTRVAEDVIRQLGDPCRIHFDPITETPYFVSGMCSGDEVRQLEAHLQTLGDDWRPQRQDHADTRTACAYFRTSVLTCAEAPNETCTDALLELFPNAERYCSDAGELRSKLDAALCEPDCSGIECGPDPVCGEDCGSCQEEDAECKEGRCCNPRDYLGCSEGNVVWYDSCDQPGDQVMACEFGCAQGTEGPYCKHQCQQLCGEMVPERVSCSSKGKTTMGTTQDQGTSAWTTYGCEPGITYAGPQNVHYIYSESGGTLDLTRLNGSASLFLLRGSCSDEAECVTAHGSGLYESIEAKTCYYLVVESDGTEASEYTLQCNHAFSN